MTTDLSALPALVRGALMDLAYPFDPTVQDSPLTGASRSLRATREVTAELLRLTDDNRGLRGANKRLKFMLDSAEAQIVELRALCGVPGSESADHGGGVVEQATRLTYKELGTIVLKAVGEEACQDCYGATDPYWVGVYARRYNDINADGSLN